MAPPEERMSHRLAPRYGLPAAATTLLLVLFPAAPVRAEDSPGRLFQQLDLSVDVPTGVVLSLSYTPTLRLLGDHLRLGLGARFTSWLGGSGVVFESVPDGAPYTLTVDPEGIHSLNLMLAASFRVVSGLEVGLNVDLVGAGFGGGVTGAYAGSDAFAGPQEAKPAGLNLFLFGPADEGQLNSEFFAAWWSGELGVRAGLSHIITEYVTTQPLDGGNTRYRSTINRLFASVGHRF